MSGVRQRWLSGRALPNVYRVVAGTVVVGSVVGMVADAVAGAYDLQAALLVDQAAAACDAAGSNTNSSLALFNATSAIAAKAGTAISVQSSSEALTLLLVTIAFVVIVSWSVALFRLAERVAMHALLSVNDRGNLRPAEANAARIVGDTIQNLWLVIERCGATCAS